MNPIHALQSLVGINHAAVPQQQVNRVVPQIQPQRFQPIQPIQQRAPLPQVMANGSTTQHATQQQRFQHIAPQQLLPEPVIPGTAVNKAPQPLQVAPVHALHLLLQNLR